MCKDRCLNKTGGGRQRFEELCFLLNTLVVVIKCYIGLWEFPVVSFNVRVRISNVLLP